MEYLYNSISSQPNFATFNESDVLISGIHYDIENSTMTDKAIKHCTWDEDAEQLIVHFTSELSEADKTKLDVIINNNT